MLPDFILSERLHLARVDASRADRAAEAIVESLEELRPWQPWVAKFEGVASCVAYADWANRHWGERFDYQILTQNGEFVGQVDLENLDESANEAEIGYWLRTSATGRGYSTEAVRALGQAAVDALGVRRLRIVCDPANLRSHAVAIRAGFSRVADGRFERATGSEVG